LIISDYFRHFRHYFLRLSIIHTLAATPLADIMISIAIIDIAIRHYIIIDIAIISAFHDYAITSLLRYYYFHC